MDGELLPGEQIPSLDDLAREHHVARTTARRAVQLLISEGLLETRPRWGTFVAERQLPPRPSSGPPQRA